MRYNKVFCILALAVILSLLMLAIPATPALAAPAITLSPTSGAVGATVTVTGTGFEAYEGMTIYIFFNQVYTNKTATVSSGGFTATFTIPSGTTAGTKNVTVQHSTPAYDPGTYQITASSFTVVEGRTISLSPTSGYVGDTVTVDGSGFKASSGVTIYFDTSNVGTATTDANGTFNDATFTVPESYEGTHTVKGKDADGDSSNVNFTVSPKVAISPTSGAVGDTITINGTGFADSSSVTIYFDTTSVGAATTNATGSFTNNTLTIPSTSRGSHTIKAQDADSNYATATFAVGHKITITPSSGAPGIAVTVNGSGFGASKAVTIKYNGAAVTTNPTTINTDATGSFTASFTVPTGAAGTYAVEASDGTYSASANFAVTINVTLSTITSEASPGYVGMEMTISGTGFTPNSKINITYATTPIVIATTTSDNNGNFSATFEIPTSEHGAHTITASDGTNTLQAAFVMESTAPATPKLLLPPTEEKAKSRPFFDWEGVTKDVSNADEPSTPVTYDLQIASDADFTDIVLEKTELTSTGYTLLKAEKLESTEKEAPYYWRVRAVDAASNVGDWTSSRTFYVGSNWGLYFLIGAGVLTIFFIGFGAGRASKRSSYY